MTTGAVVSTLLILLATWAVLFLQHASGAPLPVLEVAAGFDGYYRHGKWLPLRVRLENTGVTIAGELAIALGERRFVVSVSLPAPTKKQLYFEVMADGEPQALTVSLTNEGTTLTTVQTKMVALTSRQPLVVVLADEAWQGEALHTRYGLAAPMRVVRPTLAEFPENWKGYESVTAVILDTSHIAAFSPAQRQGLTRWLLLGGRILLVERDSASRASVWYHQLGLQDVPEHAVGDESTQVVEAGLGSLLVVRASSPPASNTVALPLPAVWSAWLNGDRATPVLWPVLLDHRLLRRQAGPWGDDARLPRLLGLCMTLYVGTVAGLLGVVRPTWARPWRGYLAVACLSLVFALLAYVIGSVVYPGAVVSHELTLVHVFPKQSEAYVTTSVTLLAPAAQRYAFEVVSSAAYLETVEAAGEAGQLSHVFDAQRIPASTELHMPLWAKRRLFVEQFIPSPGFFVEPEATANEIVNRSSFDLRNCHGLTPSGIHRLPDIPAAHALRFSAREYPTSPGFLPVREQSAFLTRVLSRYHGTTAVSDKAEAIICSATGVLPSVTSRHYTLVHTGTTVVVYHLTRHTNA